MTWQPEATAPTNRTVVLVNDRDEGVCAAECQIIRGDRFWMPHPASRDSDSLYCVTHWQPLAEPPQ